MERGMSEKTKILQIDDEEDVVRFTSQLLKGAGCYELQTAITGTEGLAAVREYRPDLVLLDIELPDMDGRDICRQIKADPELAGMLVVIMSGMWISAVDQNLGLRIGADGYIPRPVTKDDFLARIEAFARIARAERKVRDAKRLLEKLVQDRTAELSRKVAELNANIAQRQVLEEVLQKGNAFNQATLDSLSAHIAVIGLNGMMLATNEAWQRFARSNEGVCFNGSLEAANYVESCERAADAGDILAKAAMAGLKGVQGGAQPFFQFDYPIVSSSGKLWFTMRVTPLGDGSGAVVVAHENITARKLAEEELERHREQLEEIVKERTAELETKNQQLAGELVVRKRMEGELSRLNNELEMQVEERTHMLRQSEARFRTLVEQAPDALFVHDAEGNLLDANRRSCESLGYTKDEFMAMRMMDIEQAYGLENARKFWASLQPGQSVILNGIHRRKDGTNFPVEVSLGRSDIGGQPMYMAFARDVAARKQA